jgi:guanylate kinase
LPDGKQYIVKVSSFTNESIKKYENYSILRQIELMSYVSSDPNYTDRSKTESSLSKEQVIFLVTPINEATNRDVASKLANLLEGLTFPASKDEIKDYLNRKSPAMGNRINDVLEAIQNNLEDGASYDSVYEIEMASGLVKRKDDR